MKFKRHGAFSTRIGAFLVVLVAVSVGARADLIQFEADSIGPVANGFQSTDSLLVSFTEVNGSGMDIVNSPPESIGQALRTLDDNDSGYLEMDFTTYMGSLSLSFGNDDPCCATAGDLALLTLFDGASQVGQTSVVLDLDDAMDQSISYVGAAFNKAYFAYTDSLGNPVTGPGTLGIGLTEVVDNIQFEIAVPESSALIPAAVGVLLAGFHGWRRRRR